ncbi:YopX protein [uncultured Caudovirales phage]|uniref:YopX protein n=1 Tax=uncultured Caudovirales phage TaxID=2100421 RepID=A0A6J5L359_9CAUD|nr:YopX protein [uncultured Caudovirales phage]
MKVDEVQQFFGSVKKAAKALGISEVAFYLWKRNDSIPFGRQKYIELLTKGKLIAREKDFSTHYKNPLPAFRYYDKKHGMCRVTFMSFYEDKMPKITYKVPSTVFYGNTTEKISAFSTENLMQAINLVDSNEKMVYEGDICRLKNGEKFIFKNMGMINKLKKVGKFTIIGNIFECKDNKQKNTIN